MAAAVEDVVPVVLGVGTGRAAAVWGRGVACVAWPGVAEGAVESVVARGPGEDCTRDGLRKQICINFQQSETLPIWVT